jgi:RNA polymerase sigma-70 factor (ECF subfamily)
VLLYDSLLRLEPTAVVRLNRAVALAEAGWPRQALAALDGLQTELNGYQPFYAARAELLSRNGRLDESRRDFATAIELSHSPADAAFLAGRLARLRVSEKQ